MIGTITITITIAIALMTMQQRQPTVPISLERFRRRTVDGDAQRMKAAQKGNVPFGVLHQVHRKGRTGTAALVVSIVVVAVTHCLRKSK